MRVLCTPWSEIQAQSGHVNLLVKKFLVGLDRVNRVRNGFRAIVTFPTCGVALKMRTVLEPMLMPVKHSLLRCDAYVC